ncbi:hypothetical protein G5V58_02765 [Nocardioides anomalus]|uniref:PKD domain-containing protein n=1 Tax=Nocardioides anomalus TaxID=2712223 RepID=A0A6G6W9D9_9ACTN|nr:hypothetical protein [Nocardioides anomalus]QIG41844.1 hypothetical protein G5V58_02765 [Nocardioides anomalus]
MLAAPASALLAPAPALAGVTVPSCPQPGPCVVVQVVAGDQVTSTSYFYAAEVIGNADVPRTSYPVLGGVDTIVERGSSIGRLVGLAVDPGQVRYVEVVAPPPDRYARHLLTTQELGAPGSNGFQGGLLPAFYSSEPEGRERVFSYVRPQRESDDDNGSPGPDQGRLNSQDGGALLVRAHTTGDILDVDVTATPVGDAGRSFTLTAAPAGAGLAYDWQLPGGTASAEAAPTYTFPAGAVGGTYVATVGVERASDGSFGWGQVALQVGPAPSATASASTPPGTGGDGPGAAGPTRGPSGSPSGDPDPDPGDGGRPTTGSPSASPTGGPTRGAAVPTSTPGDAPTAPTTPTTPPSTPPTEPPPAAPDADEVSGILLAAAEVRPGGSVVSDTPQPSPAARPLTDPPFRVSTGVWAALGAVLLLLAGAASESGGLRRRVRLRWSGVRS